VKHSEQVHTW